ncbi:hypothetical protein FNF27_04701 [Cafeteria roenbergensis]|uniref:Uncharacterized protein n=2 Tax=Cafeteria roenbergensis TaxID=33653 RepID=A0A5A8CBN1_CAFRO|nr:hypothetical protein FNF29_05527 [Cafeteria roenbergensis]KAA0165301.1 hypothetical protein FNF31_01954 [Cafeteria roenbergensis]KAA0169489.1 hypothetical protein FNF28_02101 [Cafeteria roenbergensis]KAA0173753.1 hypothetical protein FNF27_04701 [Cafeteria roenbergensis]|eukprot:KAA0150087.1 hypothetical protein FNF29_05527 [Cafeteria roenbergensis]
MAAAMGASSGSAMTSTAAGATTGAADATGVNSKEIHTYQAPWMVYGLAASLKEGSDYSFRYAIGSFIEEYSNKVMVVQLDESTGEFVTKGSFDHPYPTTNIQWAPKSLAARRDMLATTGDFLRLWEVKDSGQVDFVSLLNPNKNSEYCAPLTSFDWNLTDENMVGTSSIDTTCTIWDINVEKVRTQLIAHDKEVYDIAFATGKHIFGTVGSDGSLRLFDLRSLEHSTIMYESPDATPLLRLRWNLMDPNYIACVTMDSSTVIVLDIRMPATAAATLRTHTAAANCLAWAPHSSCHLCSGADDNQALIWDLASLPKSVEDPILAYGAEREINNLVWPRSNPDWVTVAFDDKLQVLRV